MHAPRIDCRAHSSRHASTSGRIPAAASPGTRRVFLTRLSLSNHTRTARHVHARVLLGLVHAQLDDDVASVDAASSGTDADTIAAIVTGGQQGAVSIIRLSGQEAVELASQVFVPAASSSNWTDPASSHRVHYGRAVDPTENRENRDHERRTIDEVLCIVMRAPRSYTAEDVVEIHTHGGGICASRVLQACVQAGARLAKPGEFTLRAYLNGRLDLSQAESVASLVSAKTVAAADSALAGLSGGLGQEISGLRQVCVSLVAEIDAHIDFSDDLEELETADVAARIGDVLTRVEAALETAKQGRLLTTGIQVALVGQPNVGKSSLLNALSGFEKAIVTDIAGTTRDVVEADIVVGGVPVTLLDTAGLRVTADAIEKIGVERSRAVAGTSDVVIHVVDASRGWTAEDGDILEGLMCPAEGGGGNPPMMLLVNKCDLVGDGDRAIPEDVRGRFSCVVPTSASTMEGIDRIHEGLLELVGVEVGVGGRGWAVNERQAEALTRARESLVHAQESVVAGLFLDLWTIDLRSAVLALGDVCGSEVAEEVLDDIFSRFCIGK